VRTVINERARDEEIGKWVAEATGVDYVPGNIGIAVEKDGVLVAGVLLNEFNGPNVFAHLRVDNPFGMNKAFLREVFDYAFNIVEAKRVTAPCEQSKVGRLLAKMGFRCEAVLKDFCQKGHLYLMVMWAENCRYLEKNHGW
jgi:RimJ/RimL family protein N-acetyltransferase